MRSRRNFNEMYFKSAESAWEWLKQEEIKLIDKDTYINYKHYSSKYFNGKTISKNTFLKHIEEEGSGSFIIKSLQEEIHFLDIEDEFWGNY
tara:strand:+ start:905 stop:1177 length:273 start_codon:yes stop_codon:yes gene_type:complete